MKRLTVSEKDNTLTILQKGVGMKAEYEFAKAMQDAWDGGWRLPTEDQLNVHNAFFRLFKGNVVGRCVMLKEAAKAPAPKKEEKVEEAPVKQEVKEKKAGRPSKNK